MVFPSSPSINSYSIAELDDLNDFEEEEDEEEVDEEMQWQQEQQQAEPVTTDNIFKVPFLPKPAPPQFSMQLFKLANSNKLSSLLTNIENIKNTTRNQFAGSSNIEQDPEYQIILQANQTTVDIDNEILLICKVLYYINKIMILTSMFTVHKRYIFKKISRA